MALLSRDRVLRCWWRLAAVALGVTLGCGGGPPPSNDGLGMSGSGGRNGASGEIGNSGSSVTDAGAGGVRTASGGDGVAVGGGGAATGGLGSGGGAGATSGGGAGASGFGAGGSGGSAGSGGAGPTAGAGSGGVGGSGGSTTLAAVHYYGRWNQLADRAITVNSGSHVVASFSGTGISARFDVALNETPKPTLAWKIDDAAWQEGELVAKLPLTSGLTSGPHEVTLMVRGLNEKQNRWVPPLVSSITFLGFDVVGGGLEPSARPSRPKIEFLGDSITEGVALWSSHNGQTTACWRADGRLAYPAQTAQLLSVEWRQVGFGRQGLLIAGNGGVPPAREAFDWIYQGVRRDGWQPDLVVINQGTNDSSASAAQFASAYGDYLATVRAAYPDAKLVALRPFGGAHATDIEAQVQVRRAAGDERVYFIDTTGWLGSSDFTDGTHPNAQGSTKAAQALAAALRNVGVP